MGRHVGLLGRLGRWGCLVSFWEPFGRSCAALGLPWGRFRAVLGTVLGSFWAVEGRFETQRCGRVRFGGHFGPYFEYLVGRFGAVFFVLWVGLC